MMAAAGPARADVLACGTTITASVTLTQDMNCGGIAIIVGAAGVTVDLNGHQINGFTGGTGVSDVGHNDVTVENGTIGGFLTDVSIENSSGSVVRDLTVGTESVGQSVEVSLNHASHTTVTHNRFHHPFFGGGDQGGNGNTWSDNTFDDLGLDGPSYSEIGLSVFGSAGDLISGNKLSGPADIGGHFPAAFGIYFTQSNSITITNNELHDLALGMWGVENTGSTFRLNHGFNNTSGLQSTSGINEAYLGNKFDSNNGDGMLIESPHGAELAGNTASDNIYDGISITGQEGADSATLNLNTADHNGKSGLYSQFPTSGFGNKAKGNGLSDCFNVNCHLPVPIAVGHIPVSVAVDQATDTIYVTNSGSGTMSAIDGHTNAVTATIAVHSPEGVAVDPATDTIYVANYSSDTVSAIDGHTHAITATIAVGHGPAGLAVDPLTGTVYVANSGSDTVSVIP